MYSYLAAFLCLCTLAPQSLKCHTPPSLQQKITLKIDSILSGHRYIGSLLVAQGDTILYEKYSGLRSRRKRTSITKKTPFHVASVSKTFTAMAIMKLHQDGVLSVYDPVRKFVRNFPYKNMTLYHLLTHRSGLPYYAYFLRRKRNVYYHNKDVVNYLIRYKPRLQFKTNSRFKYSNTNYVLLAYIIEKATGVSYEGYLQKEFWNKYHFENTFVFDSKEKIPRYTPSYTYRRYPYFLNSYDYIYGDKNIYCTARDLLKWSAVLRDTSIFKPATLALCYQPHSVIKKANIKAYGLGWRMFYMKNYSKVLYHNGWWHGNKALFMRIPEKNISIIAQTNASTSLVYRMNKLLPLFAEPIEAHMPRLDINEFISKLLSQNSE